MKLPSLDVRPRMRDSGFIVAAGWLRWLGLEKRGNHGVHRLRFRCNIWGLRGPFLPADDASFP